MIMIKTTFIPFCHRIMASRGVSELINYNSDIFSSYHSLNSYKNLFIRKRRSRGVSYFTHMTNRKVLFMDIDNCLYPKSTKIAHLMGDLIDKYFQEHLSLPSDEATELHRKYYKEYGLALLGLIKNHKVDALDFNSKVDDALPLDTILKPNPSLRKLFEDIDRSKVRLWLLTNAYVNHGKRVVRLLGVDDLFEGITYCDYSEENVRAKPYKEMYEKAMQEAEVEDVKDCYFVDDSYINAEASEKFGWITAQLIEPLDSLPEVPSCKFIIRDLEELRVIFPLLFKNNKFIDI